MKHIKLFENFNNINLSIELENKVRTLKDDSDFTVDDFFNEYGIEGTEFGWSSILNGAEKYRDMSDEEFQSLYTDYKNGIGEESNDYELLWKKFINFLDEEGIDIYESYDDIYSKFMETINNEESIDSQSSDIAFYISKQCGIDDESYIKIINFINAII